MKRVRFVLLSALFLLLSSQLLLPAWVARVIKESVRESVDQIQTVDVSVRAFPAFMLLGGRMDGIDIEVREASIGELRVQSIEITGDTLVLDPLGLFRAHTIPLQSAGDLTVTVEITEDAIHDYLKRHVPELLSTVVTMTPEEAILSGEVPFFGNRGKIDIVGQFVMNDRSQLVFVPTVVRMDGARLPDFLVHSFSGDLVLPLDFSETGLPLVLDRVEMGEGRMYLHGKMAEESKP